LSILSRQFGLGLGGSEPSQSPRFYADLVRSRETLEKVAADTISVSDTRGFFPQRELIRTLADLLDLAQTRTISARYPRCGTKPSGTWGRFSRDPDADKRGPADDSCEYLAAARPAGPRGWRP
ncbi:MAG: hypothetical protein ACRELV_10130, partial [Longimicrobiales bacterium]